MLPIKDLSKSGCFRKGIGFFYEQFRISVQGSECYGNFEAIHGKRPDLR